MFVVSTMWLDSESACRCVIIVSYLLRMPLTERDRHSFFFITLFCYLFLQSLQGILSNPVSIAPDEHHVFGCWTVIEIGFTEKQS